MAQRPDHRTRSGGAPSRRAAARLAAVQALYQLELGDGSADAVIREFGQHRLGQEIDGADYGEADQALFADLVRNVTADRAELDRVIGEALSAEWSVDRLEAVLRAILRAGAYELSSRRDVPPRVILNEYVDIADAFFSGKEIGLVNGVLDRLARTLRPDEFEGSKRGPTATAG